VSIILMWLPRRLMWLLRRVFDCHSGAIGH